MGLDAFVRCRCFEEGRLRPGPVPPEDLYIDEDGYLWSHTLDSACRRLGWQDFNEEFGELLRAFEDWREHGACQHEDCMYCDEWVANISGWLRLQRMFWDMGKGRVPTLYDMLPETNGGSFPAEKAQKALDELDGFRRFASEVGKTYHDLIRERDDIIVERIPTDDPGYGLPGERSLRLEAGYAVVYDSDAVVFRARRFEKRFHKPSPGETMCELVDLESGERFVLLKGTRCVGFKSFLLEEDGVYRVGEHSDAEWACWKASILERLLRASIETGNPIQWC